MGDASPVTFSRLSAHSSYASQSKAIPLQVDDVTVRWTKGLEFGVEFGTEGSPLREEVVQRLNQVIGGLGL
jgi:hypothetical protein